ncbi:DUF2919 domain-containing protein [Enterobacillus tribolii]|uniref:DUF2919 family protein n=1 Tax=Enterobacillus tribolii TaxID=1487935 RepID=A0A370QRT0_9GAMM|nr:DUF2919 domain-containing protein [Enterobacillus tribolii]MBW7983533.1 DUF2919 domain-containing protein [Enterobacillus tribolii]RDK91968.1 hypothetical protein C8D90_104120 [Enterobacillus tribolii]
MGKAVYSPEDYDVHGVLRLPWTFWLVLILLAKTWLLFVAAGASRQQGEELLMLFYPDRGLFWLGMLLGLPAALGFILSGYRQRWPRVWQGWRWVLIASVLAQIALQGMLIRQAGSDLPWMTGAFLLLDIAALAYLLLNARLIDSFRHFLPDQDSNQV